MNVTNNIDNPSYYAGLKDACEHFKRVIHDEDRLISYVAQERILKRINDFIANKQ